MRIGGVKEAKLFFTQVIQEGKRVTWPTQKDVIFTSIIVFILALAFAIFLLIVDESIVRFLRLILEVDARG